jgi:predicted AAA+ superfamily ATPase
MQLIERHIRPLVVEALADTRAVCLLGARQTGKSTLVKQIASQEHPASYLTLDDDAHRRSALEDPTGFIAAISGPAVIDEVQRVPDLMLAIKMRLDSVRDPGQFLLTGSANIMTLPTIADALPGRVEYVRLWPFSQGELQEVREQFLDRLFAGEPPHVQKAPVGRAAYAEQITTGGFPAAQQRNARARSRFFSSYVATILSREVQDVSRVRDSGNVTRLLSVTSSRSANLMNARGMATELGVDHKTVAAHVNILEDLFLVRRLQPWHANLGSRLTKTPKLYVTDTGLLAHLTNVDAGRIAQDPNFAGPMFETFVAMELERMRELSDCEPSLFHYRDSSQREVDIVLELRSGEVAGVEVKSAASISSRDFAGLRHLRDALGSRFKAGVVLYTGEHTLPFGERLWAVPLCGLWAP